MATGRFKAVALACLVASLSMLLGSQAALAVMDGKKAGAEFPYVYQIRNNGILICSAVAVDETHLLTNAHCTKKVVALAGASVSVWQSRDGIATHVADVKGIVLHPLYVPLPKKADRGNDYNLVDTAMYDIAVLTTATPVRPGSFPRLLQSYLDEDIVAELSRKGVANWLVVTMQMRHRFRVNPLKWPEVVFVGFGCDRLKGDCLAKAGVMSNHADKRFRIGMFGPTGICRGSERDTGDMGSSGDWGGDAWCGADFAQGGDSGGALLFIDTEGRHVLVGLQSSSRRFSLGGQRKRVSLSPSILANQPFLEQNGIKFHARKP